MVRTGNYKIRKSKKEMVLKDVIAEIRNEMTKNCKTR